MSVEFRYQHCKGDFNLDVDCEIPSKGITALFGPSGSGKTSLLRLLAGLENDSKGFAKIENSVWQDSQTSLPTYQRGVGYVFQEPSLFEHLSVRQNIEFARKRSAQARTELSTESLIEQLGLSQISDRDAVSLSGGEKQRVAIARALASEPSLLLLDEPFSALDANRQQQLLKLISKLAAQLSIPMIFVSHLLDEVAQIADYIVLLDVGKVIGHGLTAEVLTDPNLPLAHHDYAEVVVPATMVAHDKKYDLFEFDIGGLSLLATGIEASSLDQVRLRVFARDVSISLSYTEDSSILNILPATVQRIQTTNTSQVLVSLEVGESDSQISLLAKITKKSAEHLALQKGSSVFAQIKSVAVLA